MGSRFEIPSMVRAGAVRLSTAPRPGSSAPSGDIEALVAGLDDEQGAALYRFALTLTGDPRKAEDAVADGFATL